MTSSQDFWARKLAKQQQTSLPGAVIVNKPMNPRIDKPWWQIVQDKAEAQTVSTEPVQPSGFRPHQKVKLTDEIEVTLDEHGQYKPRKATHTRSNSDCPDCGGKNFYRVTPSSAPRCFECGYVEGRSIADPNRPIGSGSEGPAQKARQIASGGARVDNYHGNINTASEAVSYIGGV